MMMISKKFLVLMYSGVYVDCNLLGKGVYTTEIPSLYKEGTTKEDILKKAEIIKKDFNPDFPLTKYKESLEVCQLVEVSFLGEF